MSHYDGWIKLHNEILNDPKVGKLSDHLWRRFIELQLIAGIFDYGEGRLPPVERMALMLKDTALEVRTDLAELERSGLVYREFIDYGENTTPLVLVFGRGIVEFWYVTNFETWQSTADYNSDWANIRLEVLERDMWLCQYCGQEANHVDHIIPRCQGGDDDLNNLVAACEHCNKSKGGRTPEQAGMELAQCPSGESYTLKS